MTQNTFSTLKLPAALLDSVKSHGYSQMTAIQAQSLPPILAGEDLIGEGQTGSGKTAAFALGLLAKLEVGRFVTQSLVLCPTRELADQVAQEIRKLARTIHNIKVLTLCGGQPFGPQIGSLAHGAHIIVGTPGRIEDHLRKQTADVSHVNTLVLDEADRMLDMGFQQALDKIVAQLPSNRQTLLFSATFPDKIRAIAQRVMRQPVMVKVASSHSENTIRQVFYAVDEQNRSGALMSLLRYFQPVSTVVFCNTKRETRQVADALCAEGFKALALHGDLEQKDRDRALVVFSHKSASILVATDVAARGLDIDALDAVINYQMARDSEVHVHRVGRTGRAGSKGLACTLFTEREGFKVKRLEEYLGQTISVETLPAAQGKASYKPPMASLQIDGGKKQKVRPGDLLGALTGEQGIAGSDVGKITVFDNSTYVAVAREQAAAALKKLETGKIKGRSFRVRRVA